MGKIFLLVPLTLVMILAVGLLATGGGYEGQLVVTTHEQEGYTEIEVRTGLVDYLFTTAGGELRSIFLHFAPYGLRQMELVPDTTTDPKTLARSYAEGASFPFALELPGIEAPPPGEAPSPYSYRILEQSPRQVKLELALSLEAPQLQIKKIFTIRDEPYYTVDMELILGNPGAAPLALPEGFILVLGPNIFQLGPEKFVEGEVRYLFDGRRTEAIPSSYERFEGLGAVSGQAVVFLKLKDSAGELHPAVELDERGRLILGVKSEAIELAPGQERAYTFLLYAGRPKYTLLEHSGLGGLVDLGFFSRALIAVVRFLDWLYDLTGNYGWALILFTITVRIILFPLMRKQYYSIAKMQRLAPKIQQLQERYRKEREILQRKLMELYQKEGVNPLSGCLPLLIQFPILYILWRAILYSSERIHLSPGFLWMPDLSVADPYYIIVVLNVVVMILQTRLSTPATGGGQRPNWALVYGMPLFMGFLLRNFPAGMWLYWLLTTLFQIGQQWLINLELRRLEPQPQPGSEPKADTETETKTKTEASSQSQSPEQGNDDEGARAKDN